MDHGAWNLGLLQVTLPPSILALVLAIPLGTVDAAFWGEKTCNSFTTSSAWDCCRIRVDEDPILDWLWHQNIPIKISIMNWRLMNNLVPVDVKMRDFGFIGPSKCQCCAAEENVIHVFCNSVIAQEIWDWFGMIFRVTRQPQSNPSLQFITWKNSIKKITKGHIRIIVPLVINWAIWKARNNTKHRGMKMQAKNIIVMIEKKIGSMIKAKLINWKSCVGETDFAKHFKFSQIVEKPPLLVTCQWIKPNVGWIKMNIDGCSKGNPGRAGAGGIFRDCFGNVIVSFAVGLGIQHSYMAELFALLEGLKLASLLGLHRVWIESDSLTLVNQLNNGYRGCWKSFIYFSTIYQILGGLEWKCSHIWREANAAADYLASSGLDSSRLLVDFIIHKSGPLKGITLLDKIAYPYVRKNHGSRD